MSTGPGALAGRRVLLPRAGGRGRAWSAQLTQAGAEVVVMPVTRTVPLEEPAALAAAVCRLRDGAFAWLVVTSVATVEALVGARAAVPSSTRVAAVGAATAAALRDAGWPAALVPRRHSAAGLLEDWPRDAEGKALLPCSPLAAADLADGLAIRGMDVERVDAYRVVDQAPDPSVVRTVRAGGFDAVAVTAGSVARRVAELFAPLPGRTAVVCIGPRSAEAARAAGLAVRATAAFPTAEHLIAAIATSTAGPATVPADSRTEPLPDERSPRA